MCINYALLGFYLCYFRRFNGAKRFNNKLVKKSYQKFKKNSLIYNNGCPNKNSRIRCA